MALNMFTRIIQPFRLLLSLEHIMYKKIAADQLLRIVDKEQKGGVLFPHPPRLRLGSPI